MFYVPFLNNYFSTSLYIFFFFFFFTNSDASYSSEENIYIVYRLYNFDGLQKHAFWRKFAVYT